MLEILEFDSNMQWLVLLWFYHYYTIPAWRLFSLFSSDGQSSEAFKFISSWRTGITKNIRSACSQIWSYIIINEISLFAWYCAPQERRAQHLTSLFETTHIHVTHTAKSASVQIDTHCDQMLRPAGTEGLVMTVNTMLGSVIAAVPQLGSSCSTALATEVPGLGLKLLRLVCKHLCTAMMCVVQCYLLRLDGKGDNLMRQINLLQGTSLSYLRCSSQQTLMVSRQEFRFESVCVSGSGTEVQHFERVPGHCVWGLSFD